MKVEAKKSAVTVTLTLEEDEAVMIAQLANQVAGGASPRAVFYGSFAAAISEELARHHVDVPPAAKHFKITKGKFFALPLPPGVDDDATGDAEPKLGVTPKFV